MSDRIDPSNWRSARGPWPEVIDETRCYDRGQPWCVNATAHPDRHGGYPDRDRHVPWHECRSVEAHVDAARRDLEGESVGVSIYAAAAFRFGRPREHTSGGSSPRIVVEAWPADDDQPAQRISLTLAETLRLAHILERLVDELTFFRPAA